MHTPSHSRIPSIVVAAAAAVITCSSHSSAVAAYFIGIDGRSTIPSGTYAGLPDPNFNRLTFLLGHGDHYHSKGIMVYTGPNLGVDTAVITSASNYLPEGSIAPLLLTAGDGIYAGKWISNPYSDPLDPGYDFSFLEFRSTQSLASASEGTDDYLLFHSAAGRWENAFDEADIHLELVFTTPGLNIGNGTSLSSGLSLAGDELHLGEGSELFTFSPVFWVDQAADPGTYIAQFRLTDESGTYGDSGVFEFRTQVVPEPSSAMMLLIGATWLARRRMRK